MVRFFAATGGLVLIVLLTACSTGYAVQEKTVTYRYWDAGSGRHQTIDLVADPKTFETLDEFDGYAKDATTVYYNGRVIEEAEAKTFEVTDVTQRRARDARHIYAHGRPSGTTDPAFRRYGSANEFHGYCGDSRHVYLLRNGRMMIVPGADPETFAVYDKPAWQWGHDANEVFCGTLPMLIADVETFRPLSFHEIEPAQTETRRPPPWPFRFTSSEQLVQFFGPRYADYPVPPEGVVVTYTAGEDANQFYDIALPTEQKPEYVGQAIKRWLAEQDQPTE